MAQARDLPKDLDSLTALVIEQQVSLKAKDFEIEHLRLQVARLRNLKFGQSSERFEGAVDQLPPGIDPSAPIMMPSRDPLGESITAEAKPDRKKPIRGALPDYLPREAKAHPPLCSCPDCGGRTLRKIGDVVVAPPAPLRPIPNSYVGASLLAHAVSAKFCCHLPYYRLSQMLARLGYPIDRSVLTQWARGARTT